MIDVVVLNFNDYKTVIEFIKKVNKYQNVRKILIVDNFSTDCSVEKLKKYENDKIEIIKTDKNGGYGYGNNYGIRYLVEKYNSKYILLSNPDVIVSENTIFAMENFLEKNKDYAVVAPYMLNSKSEKQYNTAFRIPRKIEYILSIELLNSKIRKSFYYKNLENEKGIYKDVDAVSGCMFLMSASKMIKYGMYDENIFLYCEELVLGIKFKENNQKMALLLQENFIHNHSVSISKTYKSIISRKKLQLNSKIYVIKKYYKANFFEIILAKFLGKILIFEMFFVSLFKKLNKRKEKIK